MTTSPAQSKRKLVWFLVLLLFLFHQDFWLWNDQRLVFGFMPVGLFYHAVFSLAAGLIWALANKYAWPEEIESWASEPVDNALEDGGKQ